MQKIKPARDVQGLEVVLGGWRLSGFYTSSKGKTHEVIQLFGTCSAASSSSCTISMRVFQALRTYWRILFNYLSIIWPVKEWIDAPFPPKWCAQVAGILLNFWAEIQESLSNKMGSRSNPNGRTWQAVLSQWAVSHSKENNLSVVPTRDRELHLQHKKHVTRVTLMGKQGYRLGMCRMLLTTPTLAAWCCMSCALIPSWGWFGWLLFHRPPQFWETSWKGCWHGIHWKEQQHKNFWITPFCSRQGFQSAWCPLSNSTGSAPPPAELMWGETVGKRNGYKKIHRKT